MPIALVVVLAILVVLNLAMTVGLIHRLREIHRTVTDWSERAKASPLLGGIPVGELAPAFLATAVDGTSVGSADFAGSRWLLGFFSSSCGSCRTYLPRLGELAKSQVNPLRPLIVIDGPAGLAADLVAMGTGMGPVVVENFDGGVSSEFKVNLYPTYYMIDEGGRIAFGSNSVDDLERYFAA